MGTDRLVVRSAGREAEGCADHIPCASELTIEEAMTITAAKHSTTAAAVNHMLRAAWLKAYIENHAGVR
jgi:hypothetical protein